MSRPRDGLRAWQAAHFVHKTQLLEKQAKNSGSFATFNATASTNTQGVPITPFHLGPGVFQKALAPRATNLVLYGVASLAIDAEPIIKGVAGLFGVDMGPLHTWTHQLEWMLVIAFACAIVWVVLRLTSWPIAVFTAIGAATTHWLLDSLMHGGGDMPLLYNTRDYGTDIAHGIAIWGFLLGTPFLIAYYWSPIKKWLRRELRLPRTSQSRSIDGN